MAQTQLAQAKKTKPSGSRPKKGAVPGLAARRWAADLLVRVTRDGRSLDGAFDAPPGDLANHPGDVALSQSLVLTTLRHLGSIDSALARCLDRPLKPSQARVQATLRVMATQLLILEMPSHAAVTLGVEDVARNPKTRGLKGLVNAVGRRLGREGAALLPDQPVPSQPQWMIDRWVAAYGKETADNILAALQTQPAIDLTLKPSTDPAALIDALADHDPVLLPTGSIRLAKPGRITDLPGYQDGTWWVQDVAATLPARLLLDGLTSPEGSSVLDLCAAPGGKTAQLAAAGCAVTALDQSKPRMARLTSNLDRLGLKATPIVGDARTSIPDQLYDAVLLDAPCSATGTLRRHPDLAHVRIADDISALATLQTDLLSLAAAKVRPGGLLIYATCSMEPEEGDQQIEAFLASHQGWAVDAPNPSLVTPGALRPDGTVRTLPYMAASYDPAPNTAGMDGFFIARLRRT